MPKPVIEVEGLSKLYHLETIGATTFRESIERGWQRLRGEYTVGITARKLMVSPDDPQAGPEPNSIWALKDVSFSVNHGDILGIIGRNGAGKSTLLKILSRITEPTTGKAIIRGRVASLLEVGTGFHPELSGRENIYLNGAILGMRTWEIHRKFDEIVAFSEIEKFIDTPVKRYSSGMYVRLAFAVAAHLDPEVLLIDEVLAVGDVIFQKKCLGKMGDVAKGGRTVLFVSHNMDAVQRLCPTSILLMNGRMLLHSISGDVINSYLKTKLVTKTCSKWENIENAPGDGVVRLIGVKVHTKKDAIPDDFDITQPIGITMEYEVLQEGFIFTHGCNLFNEKGVHLFSSHDVTSELRNIPREKGRYSSTVWIPGNLLAEGIVTASVAIFKPGVLIHFHEFDVVTFKIVDHLKEKSARGEFAGVFPGIIRPLLDWEAKKISS